MSTQTVDAVRTEDLSAQLRARTRAEHDRAEALLDLPARIRDLEDLGRLLAGWRSVWQAVLAGCPAPLLLDDRPGVALGGDHLGDAARAALDQLAADLTAIAAATGVPAAQRPGPQTLTAAATTVPGRWALGYVLRGSRVGGTVQARELAARWRWERGQGFGYLADPAAGPAWVAFRGRLDAWGADAAEDDVERVVRLARDTFGAVAPHLDAALRPTAAQVRP